MARTVNTKTNVRITTEHSDDGRIKSDDVWVHMPDDTTLCITIHQTDELGTWGYVCHHNADSTIKDTMNI